MSAARVARRAGGLALATFDPMTLVPAEWVRGDDVTGHVTGDALPSAPDNSGNGRTASQATGTKQPTWITNAVDGHAVFRFNPAASQHFIVPGYFPASGATDDLTMFIVAKCADTTARALLSMRRSATGWQTRLNSAGPNEFMTANLGATPGSLRDNISLTTTNWNVYRVARTGLTAVIQHDNQTSVGTVFSTYVANTTTPLCIGGEDAAGSGFATATFFSGDIAEWIIFNRKLTLGESDAYVKRYCAKRYPSIGL